MNKQDIEYATFGLAGFIQYRLDDGMSREELAPFMQAYLNLIAEREGREPPNLYELQSQTITDEPDLRAVIDQVWPYWLPDGEKLRVHRRSLCSEQNT